MARRSCRRLCARPAVFPSLPNGVLGVLVPGTACTGHEICVTPERPAEMGRAAVGLPLHGTLDVAPRCIGVKHPFLSWSGFSLGPSDTPG
jgi:hypothetical protein